MSTTTPIEDKDYYTVMSHFYRGELGRIMVWRQRLDVTTNWAVVSTTGLITFGLSSPNNSHLVFFLANVLCLLLLVIEGRRYRYYDAFRARVRMLEAHMLVPVVLREAKLLQGDWRKIMAEDLIMPSFKLSRIDAMARRFRRNYAYLFLIIAVGWFLKLWIHQPQSHNPGGFFRALEMDNPLPGWAFFLVILGFYGWLIWLLVRSFRLATESDEFQKGAMRREKWLK
jgi:uncharacterized membrane protein